MNDGYIRGRGSGDEKPVLAANLMAMLYFDTEYVERGERPGAAAHAMWSAWRNRRFIRLWNLFGAR
jgi:hypothetical protein